VDSGIHHTFNVSSVAMYKA